MKTNTDEQWFSLNTITLCNIPRPRLCDKVSVVLWDSDTDEEETLLVGDIIAIESDAEGLETLTVKRREH